MSIVVYIPSDEQTASTHLQELEQVIAANPSISDHVDIHLVTATRLSLHNRWRNVARAFATTEWVLLWDADFEPCTDYQEAFERFRRMSGSKREWANRLEAGNAALVIPSFEWVDPKHDHGLCPRGKEELAKHYEAMTIDAFESENPRLSHATNYARFLQRSTDEPYEVEIDDFEFVYEVYAIFRQNIDVWADERFAGFGPDRSAFTASMWLSGMDFVADGLALQGKLHREAGNRVREICKDPTMPLLERDMMRLSMASVVVQDSRNRI
nr:uncharacterized protein CI109_005655 [Kwoniella shandongensis]KAA5526059.1 hypothetical protein CI109_005655 [Kwoniella shandongensis]